MAKPNLRTARAGQVPLIRQFSVFQENKVGALLALTRALNDANIHICGISVVDTADSAVTRVVVDDPDHCREVLRGAEIPASESMLVVTELPQGPEGLEKELCPLVAAEVNIQYTYSQIVQPREKPLLALHCEDPEYAREVLAKAGFAVLTQKDISR